MTLTRAGEAFLPHAQAILDAERAAGASMADLRAEQQSTLKLGTSTGLGSHLADRQRIELAELAELPLRIASRDTNPHLVDAVVDACRAAGFTPVLGLAFTTDQDTLPAVATGKPSWTVYYAAQAAHHPAPRVAFRPLTNPTPTVPAYLAVRPGPPGRPLTRLLAACRHLVP
ncbi:MULTISPECIES: LysR substrate-binding domain-containing protein [unclassified Streptomyces]|uniref:LysR substrate-binding domain-containing protein n=1 Tax=unclassified Streptomyces TaxID=2593676 RepID=UPI0033DE25D1